MIKVSKMRIEFAASHESCATNEKSGLVAVLVTSFVFKAFERAEASLLAAIR